VDHGDATAVPATKPNKANMWAEFILSYCTVMEDVVCDAIK
jgi:hypothetical protein